MTYTAPPAVYLICRHCGRIESQVDHGPPVGWRQVAASSNQASPGWVCSVSCASASLLGLVTPIP